MSKSGESTYTICENKGICNIQAAADGVGARISDTKSIIV